MTKRILAAVPFLGVAVAAIIFHGWYIRVLILLLAVISEYEMLQMLKNEGENANEPLGYVFLVLMMACGYFFGLSGVLLILIFCIMISLIATITFKGIGLINVFKTMMTLIYPQLFFAVLFVMSVYPDERIGRMMIVLTSAMAVATDTFAYFSGALFGKRKLIPSVSPKKTVAGASGGVAGTVAVSILIGLFLQDAMKTAIGLCHFIILGVVLSVLAQFGDLAASMFKRHFNVKDFGNIIPGHGGIMDRMDSVLFICPAVYAYFMVFIV